MSLTIKHKRVLGVKGLQGLYKIQNGRSVVRELASSGRSTGCQEQLNLACMLPPPHLLILAGLCLSLSLFLYYLCLSALVFLPPPSPSPGSPSGAGGQLGSTCASCLNARASSSWLVEFHQWAPVGGEEKSVAGVAALQGECCLLWLSSNEISGCLLR